MKKNSISRRYELSGLALIVAASISLCGLGGINAGFVGFFLARFLRYFFGVGSWLAAIFLLWFGLRLAFRHQKAVFSLRSLSAGGLFAVLLAIYHYAVIPLGAEMAADSLVRGGGWIGGGLLSLSRNFFGGVGGIIFLGAGAIGTVLLMTSWSLASGADKTEKKARQGMAAAKETVEKVYRQAAPQVKRASACFYDQEKDGGIAAAVAPKDSGRSPADAAEKPSDGETAARAAKDPLDHVAQDLWVMSALRDKGAIEKGTPDKEGVAEDIEAAPVARQRLDAAAQQTVAKEAAELPLASPFDEAAAPVAPPPPAIYPSLEVEPVAAPPSLPLADGGPAEEKPAPMTAEPSLAEGHDVLAPSPAAPTAPPVTRQEAAADAVGAGGAAFGGEGSYSLPKVADILPQRARTKNMQLEQEIGENSRILTQTLANFHVKATVVNACHGPAVTRYEVEPAPGVKVSKITGLADDLALALAAFSVRIEPVPGKSVIGIEVPNKKLESVHLREVLESGAFVNAASKLTVGLGMDIGGQTILADLAKMPHLLVAGATGSGKSVCINTLITSILFKATPDEVKFILIDPKMVELSGYNDIPHLMAPVVTDAQKAAAVLNWSVREMENRYAKFAAAGVRNLAHYNQSAAEEEKMPAIVLIIDELADLMMVASHDVEDAICRLAQKARAAGLHLVLATQRPSVNVITGLIKANIPSRISFAVSSLTDSRTILDRGGAEKLLGNGDMLFSPVGSAKPLRLQGAFISDEEIGRLLDYIRSQGQKVEVNEDLVDFAENAVSEADTNEPAAPVDELLAPAVAWVMDSGQASTSGIQRRFRIGYTRAARLIDTMEELGIVGPNAGSKARDILLTREQAAEIVASIR